MTSNIERCVLKEFFLVHFSENGGWGVHGGGRGGRRHTNFIWVDRAQRVLHFMSQKQGRLIWWKESYSEKTWKTSKYLKNFLVFLARLFFEKCKNRFLKIIDFHFMSSISVKIDTPPISNLASMVINFSKAESWNWRRYSRSKWAKNSFFDLLRERVNWGGLFFS